MAYTRVAYTDLLCDFTISATSTPTTTNVGKVITNIYKQVYTIVYGTGHYSTDETTDSQTIVGTDDMFAAIQTICTEIIDAWHYSGKDFPKSSLRLTILDQAWVESIMFAKVAETTGMVRNVRLFNEDLDDVIRR